MKQIIKTSALAFLIFFDSCNSSKKLPGALKSCKNLPNIPFASSDIGRNTETTLKILADLAAAAKNDASTSKVVDASASLNIKSEFGKKLNENLVASQKVSDDFWEQNITLTQLLCFTESQTKRNDLSEDQKKQFINLLTQFLSDRNTYLNERSKKKPQS